MATDLYQGWDHRWLGTATMTLTDANGANVVSITTGKFCHLSLASVTPHQRGATAIDTGFAAFATALQTAINAVCILNYTVTFDSTALYYEIEADAGGTFTLNFGGSAGDTMRRILGFTATAGTLLPLQSSDMRPWYVCRAEINGRAAYAFPTAKPGQVRAAFGNDASIYTLAPTRLIYTAKWEHRFEQPKHVHYDDADADTLVGGASWTWEDWLNLAARYAVPCVVKDATRSMVFRTAMPFEASVVRRRKADADPQQIVGIEAQSIVGYL